MLPLIVHKRLAFDLIAQEFQLNWEGRKDIYRILERCNITKCQYLFSDNDLEDMCVVYGQHQEKFKWIFLMCWAQIEELNKVLMN